MAYDENTLRNEILSANDGDIIEITDNIHLSGTINITKVITTQSDNGNHFTIFKENAGRHFSISPSGAGGTLTLMNITLDGQETGGGVSCGAGGHLNMDSGAAIQNCSGNPAVILANGPSTSAIMKSGAVIKNCFGEPHGGGVYVGPNCTFTMEEGAVIRGCSSKEYGGGIYIVEGTFIMNGGEISDCHSAGGGGVFLNYLTGSPPRDSIIMNGGKITGCSAPFGGGILFLSTVNVRTVNTVITGNYSGTYGGGIGILVGSAANINTSLVTGNTAQLADGVEAQIYIYDDHYYGGNSYTYTDDKASGILVEMLSGEVRELMFFKIRNDNSGEYLVGFCAEPIQNIGDYYYHYFLSNAMLSREQTDKIAITIRAALGGVQSYDVVAGDAELSKRAYVAQYVIWNIVTGYYSSDELITTIPRIRAALGDSAADCLDEIISVIKQYENRILPSFAGGSSGSAVACYLKYDSSDGKYKITLTDTNGVLSYFTIDPSSLPKGLNVIFDYDNNTMTVICDDKSILTGGNVIIKLVSLFEDADASVYFHPFYQDLVIPDSRYEITIDAYIKPLISEPQPTPKKPCTCYAKATKCRKSIFGHIIWVDDDNKGDTRPPTVEIILLRDGEIYKRIVVDSADSGAFIFCCIPKGKRRGYKYDYQVDEAVVPSGYAKTIEGYTVINTLIK